MKGRGSFDASIYITTKKLTVSTLAGPFNIEAITKWLKEENMSLR